VRRLILDISTLVRWTGPPVGMIRVESELCRAARQQHYPVEFAFYDPRGKVFRSLNPGWREALTGWHAAIDTYGLDYMIPRTGWRRLLPSRLAILRRLERWRLLSRSPVPARVADLLQRATLSLKAHDFPFADADGNRISLIPIDLALGPAILPQPGDVILAASSDWSRKDPAALDALKRRTGCQIAVVCYDIIPIIRPEFFPPHDAATFRRYWDQVFTVADTVIVNSRAIHDDIVEYRRKTGATLPAIAIVPLGSEPAGALLVDKPLPRGLEPDRFALFVSTIEPRKNHRLLLDVWDSLRTQNIPQPHNFKLVFVGRPGWMVEDVLQRLKGPETLAAGIIHLRAADDPLLRVLYKAAAFCLYPSVYEGFGLPVVEAFALGKAVIASHGGALREVVAGLGPVLDPNDKSAWVAAIGAWIENPALRKAAEARVRAEFRPLRWPETARLMLAATQPAGFPTISLSQPV
jgi:glycosyltransferase involved in cell wall biosynthesis